MRAPTKDGAVRGPRSMVVGKQARTLSRQRREAVAAAQRRTRHRTRLLVGGGVLVILGLVVAIVVSLVNAAGGRDDVAADPTGTLVTPAGASAAGALVLGQTTAPVRLEVFLDYMCPFCGRFEHANAADVERLVADGTVRLELHPLSFLDRTSSGTRYSTRAANAVVTVYDRAPDRVLALHRALFAHQPEEGGTGLTSDQIADLARDAGVPADVVTLFDQEIFQPWIARSTEAAFAGGITGTPTVRINGERFDGDLYTAGALAAAIDSAKGR
jgi:protein-disulfide isomerase